MLDHPFSKDIFPNIQSKPLLMQLEAISSRPIATYLGEETDPHLSTTCFQDAIGFLGRLGTLLAHIQAAVNQHPQVLLCWAAFQPLFPKPVALHGVAVAQVQDLALGLVEPHTVGLGPSIQPVQVPLQSLPTLKQINTPAQLGVACKFTEGALNPLIQIIDKDGHHIGKPPVIWDFPFKPGLLINDGEWLGKLLHQLPQYSWVDPIQLHRLPAAELAQHVEDLGEGHIPIAVTSSLHPRASFGF
ncbi:hypothetical protein QYF61_027805 [Mycteria americana]|uniref:Uncharacterized protein n=1 Tax=Mycteria americana TaxID=33587 RepID=A0AAN7RS16_MYCAM|nr:hypothetical protein QYF61_027805 [Mycteria americana]